MGKLNNMGGGSIIEVLSKNKTIITYNQTDRIIVDDKEIHLVPAYFYFTRHFD